ncbi:hypothetical protein [Winogradskyella sp. R77965]|uniref:hypothetical protein n=1 Tax=Winogradskyella sp. R77965 TaxID=3093872 RepID=UPI0037DCD35D
MYSRIKLTKTAFILLLIAILFNSCSSDDDAPSSEDSDYFLTAKIDGVDFSGDASSLVSIQADGTDFFNIKGISSNGDQITITLISPTATGIFPMSNETGVLAPRTTFSIPSGENWSTHVLQGTEIIGSGTATVSINDDTYMEGTFSFIGYNPLDNFSAKVITEGKFKAKKL